MTMFTKWTCEIWKETPTCTMRKSAAMGARSKKGGLPVSSSTIVHPKLQMSHADVGPDAEEGRGRRQEG